MVLMEALVVAVVVDQILRVLEGAELALLGWGMGAGGDIWAVVRGVRWRVARQGFWDGLVLEGQRW
jgi:hypothetical protein